MFKSLNYSNSCHEMKKYAYKALFYECQSGVNIFVDPIWFLKCRPIYNSNVYIIHAFEYFYNERLYVNHYL